MNEKTIEDILDRCKVEGDCMIWQGAKHRQGYGFARNGHKMQTTHRIVGLLTHGDPGDPRKYQFTHTCGNLLCCNPEHIVVETNNSIALKTYRRPDRQTKSNKFGERITEEQIRQIREYEYGGHHGEISKLARAMKLDMMTVSKVLHGKTYKWIK